jgi:hypothetical protein
MDYHHSMVCDSTLSTMIQSLMNMWGWIHSKKGESCFWNLGAMGIRHLPNVSRISVMLRCVYGSCCGNTHFFIEDVDLSAGNTSVLDGPVCQQDHESLAKSKSMEMIAFLTKNKWRIIHCLLSICTSAAIRHFPLLLFASSHDTWRQRPTSKTETSLVLLELPLKEGCRY